MVEQLQFQSSLAINIDIGANYASLPKDIAEQYGIQQVPITVNFGSEVLKTGIEIDDTRLFARVDKEGTLPTTSAPAPGDFSTAYEQAFKSGAETVLCFCVSSDVSATYGAAITAQQTMPERDIQVVDTRNLTMGQGFMVLAAAEAAQDGKSVPEILSLVEQVRDRSHMYAVLPTLKYLAMSGRVGSLAAGFADVISIKPILTVRDGKLDLLERVRTLKKAWQRAIELSAEAVGSSQVERLAIVHVDAESEAIEFYKQLNDAISFSGEVLYAELTPGLSVHSGAGMVGACFVVSE
jgi:DegV family protein with EDD domain